MREMYAHKMSVARLVAEHKAFRASKKLPLVETMNSTVELTTGQSMIERRPPNVFALSDEQTAVVRALPVKAAAEMEKLIKRGVHFRQELKEGQNPINAIGGKPAYLALVCRLLLEGGFARRELKGIFMKEFGWSTGSAGSHVTIVMALLPALGINEKMGRFTL